MPSIFTLSTLSRRRLRSPLALVLVAIAVVHAVGIFWGLPASDGWDDDGIAPRDFLVGVVQTYSPGDYFTYPPVHLLILTVLNLPVVIAAALHAPALAPPVLVHEMIRVPWMTTFAVVARVVSLGMSLGIVVALGRIAREIAGERAELWAAACAGVNWAFTYYAHTTNLDVPYNFWAAFALLYVVRAIARREPRLLRRAAVFAALAVGTKDQAYAVFLLSLPTALLVWVLWDAPSRTRWREIVREVAIAAGIALGLLLLIDGAIVNPTGFRARLGFLLGSASQDHANYARSLAGVAGILKDALGKFDDFYPWVFAPFVLAGIAVAWRAQGVDRARRVAAIVPLLAIVSFTLAFDCTARRTEHRFLLPQSLYVAVYAGIAWDAAYEWLARQGQGKGAIGKWVAQGAAAVAFAWALYLCLAVDANLVNDPRYEAEQWLAAHVAPGDVIEVYGNNVYLPHFPPQAHVVRVGPEPATKRSPLPDVTEVQGAYAEAEARAPRWIVVSAGWVWRYTLPWEEIERGGVALSHVQREAEADTASRAFFSALHEGKGAWEPAHVSRFESAFWPAVDIHASTSREIRIFERRAAARAEAPAR
jgi:hypothetical protein